MAAAPFGGWLPLTAACGQYRPIGGLQFSRTVCERPVVIAFRATMLMNNGSFDERG
jgi:hypothetical protein